MINWNPLRPLPLAAALLLISAATQAQEPQPTDSMEAYGQATATAASFSDTELKSFVQAREKVDAIRTEISSKLSNTQDPQEVQKLQQAANTRMIAAVESAGLSRTRYNEIAQAVMGDPALAQKVEQLQ